MNEKPGQSKRDSRRFAANLTAILTSDLLNRGTTFLIYIMVARELGTYAFGQMSLALTLFYSFQVVAAFGMQTLITREVAKDKAGGASYFANSIMIATITSLGSMMLLVAAVLALNYPLGTRNVILVTSLGLLPFALSTICEAIIRAWEKMHLIAFVQVPVNILKVLVTVYLLWNGGNIFQIMIVIVAARLLIAVSLLLITVGHLERVRFSHLDSSFAWSIVRRSATFVTIDTVTAWWAGLNIVLLSKLASESDVGLYNAAAQLMIPMAIFYQSVMVSAFPMLCRKYSPDRSSLDRLSNRLIGLLMIMAIPGTIGLLIVAAPALEFVFKKESFAGAVNVVRITAFILIVKALTFALGHLLLAGNRERTTLRIVMVNLIVGLGLGWVLISSFGVIGAAVAALFTRLVDLFQHFGPVKTIVAKIELGRIVWKPILASAVMAGHLLVFHNQFLPLLILSAATVYFVVLLALESWVAGGWQNLRARYL